MDLNEKLQNLRKQKGLTQEELAEILHVSRTAISKWEAGRGYPNIVSLKAISKLFSVTIDELLSSDELLFLAEEDNKQKQNSISDLIFGLLDVFSCLLLFFPLFAQRQNGIIQEVSLLSLTSISTYLKVIYFIFVASITLSGILNLTLQNCNSHYWLKIKDKLSLALSIFGVLLFIVSSQIYSALFLFVFLIIKMSILIKK